MTIDAACAQLGKPVETDSGRDRDEEVESALRWPFPQCPPEGARDVSTPWWKGKGLRSSKKAAPPSPASVSHAAAPSAGPQSLPDAASPTGSPVKHSEDAEAADAPVLPTGPVAVAMDAGVVQVRLQPLADCAKLLVKPLCWHI